MSELAARAPVGLAETVQQSDGASPTGGMLLRQARLASGLHVAALAVALKVPVRKLEALEQDRFDLLPDVVFVRALAASICRTLKIDPRPVLDRLPQITAPRLAQSQDGINEPFHAPHNGSGLRWFDQFSRPVVLAVFALLLGALILIFLPLAGQDPLAGMLRQTNGAVPAGEAVVGAAGYLASSQQVAIDNPARIDPGPITPVASTPAVASPTAVMTPSPGLAVAVALDNPTPSNAADAASVVVFRSAAVSWVQVIDVNGVVVLRKLLAAGETAGASGSVPLRITVGSASGTEVQVRGEPFDLTPVSRDNVARFEVK